MKKYIDTNCPFKTRYEKDALNNTITVTDNCDSDCEWFMDEENSCSVTVIAKLLKAK